MKRRRILSFKYAFEGIYQAFKKEPNLKFHFFAAAIVLFWGLKFQISALEWLALIITIGLVITVELTNTAIEAMVDHFTQEEHPGAKITKDISAGAVLFASLMAMAVGVVIFLPRILLLF